MNLKLTKVKLLKLVVDTIIDSFPRYETTIILYVTNPMLRNCSIRIYFLDIT